jgi:hypothetical protein
MKKKCFTDEQIEKENKRLKRLVADLSLDKHMLTCRNFCT